MGALHLDRLTWPEIQDEIARGRDAVLVPFGSTEQHGRHLPVGTDAILGDEFGEAIADRLDAFLAPTVRFGCSSHHLAFPGTITLDEETFRRVVADVVGSLSHYGFKKIVLIPTHGGNFKPLAEASETLAPIPGVEVIAYTDLAGMIDAAFRQSGEMGISPWQSGAHAGEWETSLMLALKPELVRMEQAVAGFVGELAEAMTRVFQGIHALDENGVIGDPGPATAGAGKKYKEDMVEVIYQRILEQMEKSES
jgi:creatinine amidohydrolase